MLSALHIQNFILIDSLTLSLGDGLTALTGETGAGKSILLDALGLAAGAKIDKTAIRAGAEQGVVTAAFEVGSNHPVWAALANNGLSGESDLVILRRVQTRDGRSRAFINDQPVSIALLREIGATLIEIHGQHDGRGFLSAATHRSLLDEFAGIETDVVRTGTLYRAWRETERTLDEKRADRQRAVAEADYLAHVVEELSRLAPKEGEEEALVGRRTALQAAEKISVDLGDARSALDRADIESAMALAARRVTRVAGLLGGADNLAARTAARFEAALSEYLEADALLEETRREHVPDTDSLEIVDERLFALRAAARKHGVQPDQLSAFLARARATLADLEAGEANFTALEEKLAAARKDFEGLARKVSAARIAAAEKLDKAVALELKPLKLGAAKFSTEVRADSSSPQSEGIDRVEFMVATNPGAPAGPLKSIASGGELSRFVLAMKAALSAKENRTVIIFDEIDAGVGGAVADAVGERLARLGRDAQVLVVTHSPQVAARASAHLRVSKAQSKTKTTTSVDLLAPDERVEEIARMLSGARITDAAREAARQLIGAESPPRPRRRRA